VSDVIRLIRDASALRAALYQYDHASEAHDARRSRLLLAGEDRTALLHERADRIVLRAWAAEMADPDFAENEADA
jgi:hypothetical protein